VNRQSRPLVITDAQHSLDDQLHRRQVRYGLMMLTRAICVVLVVVFASLRVPWPWLWVPLLVLGAVVLPWMAVVLANDRPPKEKYRLAGRLRQRAPAGSEPRAVTATPPGKVIDHE
jgi:Flp pilus assembly protein TadB